LTLLICGCLFKRLRFNICHKKAQGALHWLGNVLAEFLFKAWYRLIFQGTHVNGLWSEKAFCGQSISNKGRAQSLSFLVLKTAKNIAGKLGS
jgi:hypothetical protein